MGNKGKIAEHAPPPGDVGGGEVRRDLSPPGAGGGRVGRALRVRGPLRRVTEEARRRGDLAAHRVVGAVRGRRGTQRWGGRRPSGRCEGRGLGLDVVMGW